jgi:GNAT superfamily N-acetyltransferase
MHVALVPASPSVFREYARIPIAFEVRSRLRLPPADIDPTQGLLEEEPVAPSYVKDYDAIPGQSPLDWSHRRDVSHWGVFLASHDGQPVGGAVVIPPADPPTVANLWDLRAHPAARRRGVGAALFAAAATWARSKGHLALDAETQHINVPACRFYAAQGCTLILIEPGAYPNLPHEVKLVWRKTLA